MSLIEWKPEYSVGNTAVDHEHSELIALINDLHAMLARGATQDQVVETLGEIYAQIAAHFALEEKIMRERGYDQYREHKEDHERLLDEICDIMDRYEDEADPNYDAVLSERLREWFTAHFKTKDARLHRMLG